MNLQSLIQSAFTKLAALLAVGWTGRFTLTIDCKQGRIMIAKISHDEVLTID